jgi:hypothetical protein
VLEIDPTHASAKLFVEALTTPLPAAADDADSAAKDR